MCDVLQRINFGEADADLDANLTSITELCERAINTSERGDHHRSDRAPAETGFSVQPNNSELKKTNVKIWQEQTVPVDEDPEKTYKFKRSKTAQGPVFICATDCPKKLPPDRVRLIKTEGVTRETLRSHTIECHNISLNLKAKTAKSMESYQCCGRTFAKKSSFKHHTEKNHQQSQNENINSSSESNLPVLEYEILPQPAIVAQVVTLN